MPSRPARLASPARCRAPPLQLLPGWLTTLTLALLLSYITWKMGAKAVEIRRKEQRALAAGEAALRRRRSPPGSPLAACAAGDEESLTAPLLAEQADAEADGQHTPRGRQPYDAARHLQVAAAGDALRNDTPSPVTPLAARLGSRDIPAAETDNDAGSRGSSLGASFHTARDGSVAASLSGGAAPGDAGYASALEAADAAESGSIPEAPLTPGGSAPLPIEGGAGVSVLPLLTPVE